MSNKPDLSLHIHAKNQKIYMPFSVFLATLKLLIMCMMFSKHNLKKIDGFSKYVKLLIYYRGQKLENCYLTTEEKI